MSYMYFSLVYKENPNVELKGCINLDTVEDDEPEVEYLQNDGTWDNHHPSYCKVSGEDLSFEMDRVKELEAQEWTEILQFICDWDEVMTDGTYDDMGDDFIFNEEYGICNLYVAYDDEFSNEKMYTIRAGSITGEVVDNNYKGGIL